MVAAGIGALGAWYGVEASVIVKTRPQIIRNLSSVPHETVAVVLGSYVTPDGQLSPPLKGRVDAAIDLYRAGKVEKLLMSGDNSRKGYDEPSAMKSYAVAHGIPAADVIRDFAGFHTFDTCYRAKHVFGLDRAVFVSQAFHLPRTLYLADAMGIDAVGYVAPDNISPKDIAYFESRERACVIGSVLDISTGRKPTFPGPEEPPIDRNIDPNR